MMYSFRDYDLVHPKVRGQTFFTKHAVQSLDHDKLPCNVSDNSVHSKVCDALKNIKYKVS